MPTTETLETALTDAESSHHQFQTIFLKGVRDQMWASYYAAFVLGRLPDVDITPSAMTELLNGVTDHDWVAGAAKAIEQAAE